MKRQDLMAKCKELGIENEKLSELIDYVMDANGTDINNTKASFTNQSQELETLRKYKTDTETKLAGFKDYDDLKKFKADTEAKAENQKKSDFLKSQGCKHPDLFVNQIDWSKASYDEANKKYTGIDEALKSIKETYKDMFVENNPQAPGALNYGKTSSGFTNGFEAYKAAHPELDL